MAISLVTGSTGFVGSALTQYLLDKKHQVYITKGIHGDENRPLVNGRQLLNAPFQDIDWKSLPKPDIVFHLAGCTDTMIHDEDYMMQVNCYDALKFIKEAIEQGVKQIVYASSAAVYGRYKEGIVPFTETDELKPLNIYGESKAELDRQCMKLAKGFDGVIIGLRYSNVYGGAIENHKQRTSSMVWQLYQKMKQQPPTLFKWGEQARDFVHVKDIVLANLLASHGTKSGIYNIGAGKMWSFNRVVEIINELLDTNWKTRYIDNPIQQYYQDYNSVSIDLARKELWYEPEYDLEEGLREIHLS